MARRPASAPASGRVEHGSKNPPPEPTVLTGGPGVFRSFSQSSKFAALNPLRYGQQGNDSFNLGPQSSRDSKSSFRSLDISRINMTRHNWSRLDTFQTPTGHLADSGDVAHRSRRSARRDKSPNRTCCNFQESMLQHLEEDLFEEFQMGLRALASDVNTNMNEQFNGLRQEIMTSLDDIASCKGNSQAASFGVGANATEIVDEIQAGSFAVLDSLKDIRAGIESLDADSIVRSIHDSKIALIAELDRVNPTLSYTCDDQSPEVFQKGITSELEKLCGHMYTHGEAAATNSRAISELMQGVDGIQENITKLHNSMQLTSNGIAAVVEGLKELSAKKLTEAIAATNDEVARQTETEQVLKDVRNSLSELQRAMLEGSSQQQGRSSETDEILCEVREFKNGLSELQHVVQSTEQMLDEVRGVKIGLSELQHSTLENQSQLKGRQSETDDILNEVRGFRNNLSELEHVVQATEQMLDEIQGVRNGLSELQQVVLAKTSQQMSSESAAEQKTPYVLLEVREVKQELSELRDETVAAKNAAITGMTSITEVVCECIVSRLAEIRKELQSVGIDSAAHELRKVFSHDSDIAQPTLPELCQQIKAMSQELQKCVGHRFLLSETIPMLSQKIDAISEELQKGKGQGFSTELTVLCDQICSHHEGKCRSMFDEVLLVIERTLNHQQASALETHRLASAGAPYFGDPCDEKLTNLLFDEDPMEKCEHCFAMVNGKLPDGREDSGSPHEATYQSSISEVVPSSAEDVQKKRASENSQHPTSVASNVELAPAGSVQKDDVRVFEEIRHVRKQGEQLHNCLVKLDQNLTCQFRVDISSLANKVTSGQKDTLSKLQRLFDAFDGMQDLLNSR